MWRHVWICGTTLLLLAAGCGYRYVASPLRPAGEAQQSPGTAVSDDGTVTFTLQRLEIGVQPLSDPELNRQFSPFSNRGTESTNPYTYGDWQDPVTGTTPPRFTVFVLKVSNYEYPKVRVNPLRVVLRAANGRKYEQITPLEFSEYYRPFVTANSGNAYGRYRQRQDIFTRTRFRGDFVFSGQEEQGFLVFPPLHDDVRQLRLHVEDVELRYDYRGEPTEAIDLDYYFERDVDRIYPSRQETAARG